MCCCGKPVVNGEVGYRWNNPNAEAGVHPVNAPDTKESDKLLYDLPGRCGGLDSHSYHYRIVRNAGIYLLVRHGGGDERIYLSSVIENVFLSMGSETDIYWTANTIYHAHANGARDARNAEATKWTTACAEKRVSIRRTRGFAHVSIESSPANRRKIE